MHQYGTQVIILLQCHAIYYTKSLMGTMCDFFLLSFFQKKITEFLVFIPWREFILLLPELDGKLFNFLSTLGRLTFFQLYKETSSGGKSMLLLRPPSFARGKFLKRWAIPFIPYFAFLTMVLPQHFHHLLKHNAFSFYFQLEEVLESRLGVSEVGGKKRRWNCRRCRKCC